MYCCTSHYISPPDNALCLDKKRNHQPCHQTHPSVTTKSPPSVWWPVFLVFQGGILLINEHPRNQNARGSASYPPPPPCAQGPPSVLINSPVRSMISTREARKPRLFYRSFLFPLFPFLLFHFLCRRPMRRLTTFC